MILFFLLNILALVSAFLCARGLFDFGHYHDGIEAEIDFYSSVFLLYLTQIVGTELLLGLAGRLYLFNLVLINLAVFLLALYFNRRDNRSPGFSALGSRIQAIAVNKTARLVICVVICFGLAKALVNLFNPPFGWDSLNYHFTYPVEWLKHGNLNCPITINDDFAPTYYPINGSLYFLWLIIPLRSVFLADLGQVPFFILSFFALFSLARKLRLNNEQSFFAAGLFVLIPNFFKQLQIAYVDVMVAALFFYCLNFLFLLNKRFSLANVFFFALGLGWLLGVKLIALPYCVLLLVPFLFICIRNMACRDSTMCCPYSALLVVFITVLIFGGFSYIRNFMQTGNPFYPLDVRFFGKNIFHGVIARASYAAHFRPEDYGLGKLLFHEGLGGQTLIFVLPAVFLGVPVALLRKRGGTGFFMFYFLALPFLLWCVFRYLIPFANTRYLYPLLGIGMVSAFYAASLLNIPRPILKAAVALCVLASVSELAKRQELVTSILLSIALFFLLPLILKCLMGMRRVNKTAVIVLSVLALFILLKTSQAYYLKNEYRRYELMRRYSGFWPDATSAWAWLNSNTTGDNIAYVGRPVPFPLYGRGFKNNVYYVSVNNREPAKLEYYPGSFYHWDDKYLNMQRDFEAPGNYRSAADYPVWLNNLRSKDTDYLFVYSLHQAETLEFPIEDQWAAAHPDIFVPVFSSKTINIYKVSK